MQYKRLEECTDAVKNDGVVLCTQYAHLLFPEGEDAIHHNDNIKHIDGKNWELFNVYHETKDGYYGMPVLGFGLLNCFIRKEDSRKLLPEELEAVNKTTIGLYGSHTGKYSGRSHKLDVKNVVDKYEIEGVSK